MGYRAFWFVLWVLYIAVVLPVFLFCYAFDRANHWWVYRARFPKWCWHVAHGKNPTMLAISHSLARRWLAK